MMSKQVLTEVIDDLLALIPVNHGDPGMILKRCVTKLTDLRGDHLLHAAAIPASLKQADDATPEPMLLDGAKVNVTSAEQAARETHAGGPAALKQPVEPVEAERDGKGHFTGKAR